MTCEFCGGPEPCDRRACMDALAALAAYYDEEAVTQANGIEPPKSGTGGASNPLKGHTRE